MAIAKEEKIVISDPMYDIEKQEISLENIPSNRVISFSFKEFIPERVSSIKGRINTLVERILICPAMRAGYIQEINKIILFQRKKGKKYE